MDKILLVAGCGIFVLLGVAHLAYTLWTGKLDPRDPQLIEAMKQGRPVITRQTTMWKAWVGFNLSHSLGAILFGLLFIDLAIESYGTVKASFVLNAMLLGVPAIYLTLAIKYWFKSPRNGILVAWGLIIASVGMRYVA
jgi:hypothetical protein